MKTIADLIADAREAVDELNRTAEGDSNDAEIEAGQEVRDCLLALIDAIEAPKLHGLGANDYEIEPIADESGPWVNIPLYERDLDADGEPVPLGSLLLSTREARDLQHELRAARRLAEDAYARQEADA